jgi:glycolate oxidase iron-sulfur subunit
MALAAEYDNMLRCIRCAACLTSCPTYVISRKEEEGPRGRIAIMRAIVEGHLDVTPDAVEHVGNCLLCEACSHVCPTGVEMERLGVAFREELRAVPPRRDKPEVRPKSTRLEPALGVPSAGAAAASGFPAALPHEVNPARPKRSLAERFAYGWLFGDLAHFRATARLMRLYQRSGLQWLARHLGILRLLGMRDMERLLPAMPGRFVVPRGQTTGTGQPVQVFAGCIMSTAFALTTERTAELLAAFGCEAGFPQKQVCCGALQFHAGATARTKELARANLEAFDGDAPVVVNAAGCGAMLKHYGQLLPDDARAQAFATRVKDVSEVLAGREPFRPPRELQREVVLQDACHLLHAQHVDKAPRTLLRAIPGLDLREIPEAGICCGSAGIYNVTHREVSEELQRRKCANILESGAATVVTGNPGCLLQIRAGLPDSVRVQHIVDLLWEAYCE